MSIRARVMGGVVVGLVVLGAVASHEAGGQPARPVIATEAARRNPVSCGGLHDRGTEPQSGASR